MRLRWLFASLTSVAFLAVLVAGVRELWPQSRYNVIILTVESAQTGVISPEITPNIWRLLDQGIRFDKHRAVSAWTATNIVSLLTGVSPFLHGVHSRDQQVPADADLPLKELARGGWRVAGLQPFMQIDGFQSLGLQIEPGADLQAWLARRAGDRQPFVLWHHYLDTHLPYAPPPPYRPDVAALLPLGDTAAMQRIEKVMTLPAIPAGTVDFQPGDRPAIRALYLANFTAFDAWFARLWDFLEKSGLRDNTLIVLTADHGEEQLEHGLVGHASTTHAGHLHEELVHVPLALWLPKSYRAPDTPPTSAVPNDHLDVMPTIFQVLGVKPARPFAGANLLALSPARPWRGVTSAAGFGEPDPYNIRRFIFAMVDGKWKLHLVRDDGVDRATTLYDLDSDPGETRDVAAANPEIVARLREALTPDILTMRLPTAPAGDGTAIVETPRWVFPARGGEVRYDDLAGRFRLEWSGRSDVTYRVQYQAGEGFLSLSGEFNVDGVVRDFGVIDRAYWNKWLTPYGKFRLRVGVAGRDDRWSDWLEMRALP